jgi:hypothetical protein
MLSYKSAGLDNRSLTFTPYNDDDYSEAEGDTEDSSDDYQEGEDGNSSDRKRIRLAPPLEIVVRLSAAMYEDSAIPSVMNRHVNTMTIANLPLAFTARCVKRFGILAPASPCISDFVRLPSCYQARWSCPGRSDSTRRGHTGQGAETSAVHATRRHSVAAAVSVRAHMPYANERDTEISLTSRFWCQYCNPLSCRIRSVLPIVLLANDSVPSVYDIPDFEQDW